MFLLCDSRVRDGSRKAEKAQRLRLRQPGAGTADAEIQIIQ